MVFLVGSVDFCLCKNTTTYVIIRMHAFLHYSRGNKAACKRIKQAQNKGESNLDATTKPLRPCNTRPHMHACIHTQRRQTETQTQTTIQTQKQPHGQTHKRTHGHGLRHNHKLRCRHSNKKLQPSLSNRKLTAHIQTHTNTYKHIMVAMIIMIIIIHRIPYPTIQG